MAVYEQYLRRLPRPAAADINGGLSPLRLATQRQYLGNPRAKYGRDCQPVTNDKLKKRIITASVGPFRVTGFDLAVWSLRDVLADVYRVDPVLHDHLGTAGMLCCRLVRGSDTAISNHSYGMPVDLTVFGELDVRGDKKVQSALLDLYPTFHRHGWYWGAEYPTEDAMHFEPADETFRGWMNGTIPAPTAAAKPVVSATTAALVVNGVRIEGIIHQSRLYVPARAACAALKLASCEFVPPSSVRSAGQLFLGIVPKGWDSRLYVRAADLAAHAGAAGAWNSTTLELCVTLD